MSTKWTNRTAGDPTDRNGMQIYNGKQHIATAHFGMGVDVSEATANARLIAAAPELLAATKRMINWLEGVSDEIDIIDMALQARAAIQKAEG